MKTSLTKFTVYSKNHIVFLSVPSVFCATVRAAVILVDVLDDQSSPVYLHATFKVIIIQLLFTVHVNGRQI